MANQASKANKLTGVNPLAYMGVNPSTPPQLIVENFQPNTKLYRNMPIGTTWVVNDPVNKVFEYWVLLNYVATSQPTTTPTAANWVQVYPQGGSGSSLEVPCDTGTATASVGILNINGDSNITTSGSGDTVVVDLNDNVSIVGTLASASLTTSGNIETTAGDLTVKNKITCEDLRVKALDGGVVVVDVDGNMDTEYGEAGQVLLGTDIDEKPVFSYLTSNDNSITFVTGSGSLDLSASSSIACSKSFCFYQDANIPLVIPYGGSSYATYSESYVLGTATGGELSAGSPGFDKSASAFYAGGGTSGTPAKFTVPATGVYYFYLSALVGGLSGVGASSGYPEFYFIPGMVVTGSSAFNLESPNIPAIVARSDYHPSWINNADQSLSVMNRMIPLTAGDEVTFRITAVFYGMTRDINLNVGPNALNTATRYATYVMGYRVSN